MNVVDIIPMLIFTGTANEKKWIVIRFMFSVGFGIVWLAILMKVVLVIIDVAKCLPEPKPLWYQDNVVYKLNIEEFAGGLSGKVFNICTNRTGVETRSY